MRPPVDVGVHRAPRCEPVVSLVRSRRAPPVPLIVLPKSCSCRWGPCPRPIPRLACLFSFFLWFFWTPSLALVPPSAYPMRERSPVPCAQPSPRGDAPSPLAFAKSCKGGDVSVLDPALAWDVRCIYFIIRFTQHTPLLKIPVWWRRAVPTIPPLGCVFSFFFFTRRPGRNLSPL